MPTARTEGNDNCAGELELYCQDIPADAAEQPDQLVMDDCE